MGSDLKKLIAQLRRYLSNKCPICGQRWAVTWHWTSRLTEPAKGYFCLACPCGHEERTKDIDLTNPDTQALAAIKGTNWAPMAIGVVRVEEIPAPSYLR